MTAAGGVADAIWRMLTFRGTLEITRKLSLSRIFEICVPTLIAVTGDGLDFVLLGMVLILT